MGIPISPWESRRNGNGVSVVVECECEWYGMNGNQESIPVEHSLELSIEIKHLTAVPIKIGLNTSLVHC